MTMQKLFAETCASFFLGKINAKDVEAQFESIFQMHDLQQVIAEVMKVKKVHAPRQKASQGAFELASSLMRQVILERGKVEERARVLLCFQRKAAGRRSLMTLTKAQLAEYKCYLYRRQACEMDRVAFIEPLPDMKAYDRVLKLSRRANERAGRLGKKANVIIEVQNLFAKIQHLFPVTPTPVLDLTCFEKDVIEAAKSIMNSVTRRLPLALIAGKISYDLQVDCRQVTEVIQKHSSEANSDGMPTHPNAIFHAKRGPAGGFELWDQFTRVGGTQAWWAGFGLLAEAQKKINA
jgi:hypothetical protein